MERQILHRSEQNILLILFLAIVITLPFSISLNSKTIVLFASFNIWLFIKYKYRSLNRDYYSFCVANCLFMVIFLIGFFYSTNLISALRLLETRIVLLIFPLLLLTTGSLWEGQLVKKVLLSFAGITIFCGLIIQSSLILDLIRDDHSLSNLFYWKVSGSDLSERIGIHPTYLSMYAIFSIGIIYEYFIAVRTKLKSRIVAFISILYLILLTLHLSSRISIPVLFLVLVICIYYGLERYGAKVWLWTLPFIMAFYFLVSSTDFSMVSRLENNIGLGLGVILGNEIPNDFAQHDQRSFAWYCSVVLMRDNVWLGVGSGDVDDELSACYLELKANELADIQLNTHNQYFDSLLRNGVAGFIALLVLYFYNVFKFKVNRLYLIFVLIVSITSFTENILERQKGVVFFAVFSSLLFKYHNDESPHRYEL